MEILFSIPVKEKHQTNLKKLFPDETFRFHESMEKAFEEIEKADVLVTSGSGVTEEIIRQAHSLQWIMVLSAGVDKMPLDVIQTRNITVTNARGIHQIPMSEYAISMLLQVTRQEKKLMENEEKHEWNPVHVNEMHGRTLVIAGTGAIGQAVAKLAKAFHMKTLGVSRSGRARDYFDKNVTPDRMREILPEADYLVSVLPDTPETEHFFQYQHFQALPDHAVFLNMGRGSVVDSRELYQAIQEKEIQHAVLDVFDEEPLPENHPFWKEENITITPHISGLSPHYMTRALDIFVENLETFRSGENEWINPVDISRGY